jgi:hypothetical protein
LLLVSNYQFFASLGFICALLILLFFVKHDTDEKALDVLQDFDSGEVENFYLNNDNSKDEFA